MIIFFIGLMNTYFYVKGCFFFGDEAMDWYEVSASAHQTEYKTDFGKPNFLFT